MALNFVNSKPKNEGVYAKSLDEAMTPQTKPLGKAQAGFDKLPGGENLLVVDKVDYNANEAEYVATHHAAQSIAQEGKVTEEANSEVLTLVDQFTELQRKIDAADISDLLKEQEEIKKKLAVYAKADTYPAKKPVELHGTQGNYVLFSAKSNKTAITDKNGLVVKIGMDKWVEYTDITLGNAAKLLSENELEKFTTTTEGSRSLKTCHYEK